MEEEKTVFKIETTDRNEMQLYLNANKFCGALFEIKYNFWRNWKHDEESLTLDSMKEKLNEIFEDFGITDEDVA